jgi:acyl carrier protein
MFWAKTDLVHIGRPIANTQVYILDRYLRPVPIGVTGEIYIGGAGVARGYLNRPELTAERFVADPFSHTAQARMYRSGDLGRWLADGSIEFLGRNDDQVKIRGYRIELGEIEARLAKHEHVKEVAVQALPDSFGEKRLVAYIVPHNEGGVSVEDLRTHLKQVLPTYMIPSAFVLLESFPLTTNGKLDRRALPEPDHDAYASRHYEAPQGEVEELLATVWRELLSVSGVGRNDHFFDLGGHSILAMQVAVRIRSALSIELPVRLLFEAPVLRDLANEVDNARQERLIQIIGNGGNDIEELLGRVAMMSECKAEELLRALTTGGKT